MLLDIQLAAGEVDERKVLQALNRSFLPFEEESRKPMYRDLALRCGIRPEMAALAWEFGVVTLRELVDDWIESGRQSDGSEDPCKRDLRSARVAWGALESYFRTLARLDLVPSQDGSVSLRTEAKSWQQLRDEAWLPGARQQVKGYARVLGFPLADLENPDTEIALLLVINSEVHNFAAATLLSELRWVIAKCRYKNCSQPYFVLPKRRQGRYANGLFCCTAHNRAASATKSMESKRTNRTSRLVERAAQELSRMGDKPQAKEKLVGVLNRMIVRDPNLRTLDGVKVNWVTRHWEEIKRKAEGLSHVQT